MGQAVYHCGDQYFVVNNLVPAVEGEIGCDDGRLLVGAEGEMVKEHLCAGLVAGDVSELITDDHVVSLELVFQRPECQGITALAYLREQSWHGCEQHRVSGITCGDTESCRQMSLA